MPLPNTFESFVLKFISGVITASIRGSSQALTADVCALAADMCAGTNVRPMLLDDSLWTFDLPVGYIFDNTLAADCVVSFHVRTEGTRQHV